MKQWRKQPYEGTFLGINVKRLKSHHQIKMVNHGSILLQRLMLQAGVWPTA